MKIPALSNLASHPETMAQIIMPEINFLLEIALATLSAPHQRWQHHIKGAPLLTEDLMELTTHLAPLLIAVADALLKLPPLCKVHSRQSSRHYHSAMTVAKQAWHGHLPHKPNAFSNS